MDFVLRKPALDLPAETGLVLVGAAEGWPEEWRSAAWSGSSRHRAPLTSTEAACVSAASVPAIGVSAAPISDWPGFSDAWLCIYDSVSSLFEAGEGRWCLSLDVP